jgi:hypothetical protein
MLLYGFVECMLVALRRIRGWSSGQQWLISGALQLCKLALLATVGAQHSSVSVCINNMTCNVLAEVNLVALSQILLAILGAQEGHTKNAHIHTPQ